MKHRWAYALTTHFNPRESMAKMRFRNILHGSGERRGYGVIAVCMAFCLFAGNIVSCRVETEPEPVLPEVNAEELSDALAAAGSIYLCDDNYRHEGIPTHGDYTITFPDRPEGYSIYTCQVVLCTDGCSPHDVVWRNFFGYAGGFPLQETEVSVTGNYPINLYRFTYPEETLEQILSDMEKGGASEEQMLEYRNRRWYLYLLTVDEEHYACITIEPEDLTVPAPENEQEYLDTLIAEVQITVEDSRDSYYSLYETFLSTTVAPYLEYTVATEYLDLDENGIPELILYNWGASANCGVEIFTIENGQIRSFYTGTNVVTHYAHEYKALAEPSVHAADQTFWGLPTSYDTGKAEVPLWFRSCVGQKGHILYSHNGSSTHSSDDYWYFTSGEDGCLQAVLLGSFRLEAVDSNPELYGWECIVNGETVPAEEYRTAAETLWKNIAVRYGVQFTAENVYHMETLDSYPAER